MKGLAPVVAGILLLSAFAGRPALVIGALCVDQAIYFRGLTGFIHDVDEGCF